MVKLLVLLAILAFIWHWVRKDERKHIDRSLGEAAALLEIPVDADRDTILAAHRRIIARAHPDMGGDASLATKVNAARDTLLKARPSA